MPLEPIVEEKLETEIEIAEMVSIAEIDPSAEADTRELIITKPAYSDSDDEADDDHDDADVSFPDPDYSSDEEKPSTSKLLTCYVCKGFNGTERALGAHLQDHHSALSPYYCDRCLVGFEDMMAINYHYQSHEFPYGCLFCEELFGSESELETHNKSCIGYQCSYCLNHFQFVQNLKEHDCKSSKYKRMRVVTTMVGTRRNQTRFIPQICGMCNEDLGKNHRLAYHFEREHENCQLQLFSCDICPKKFTMLMAARLHRLSHKKDAFGKQRKAPVTERNECNICSREFRFNKELLAHIEAEHADSGVEFHQCTKCTRKFTSEAKLLKHDYNTHQGKQPQFFCSFCGRVFNKKLGLKDHENLHRGITEYHCKDCNKVSLRCSRC